MKLKPKAAFIKPAVDLRKGVSLKTALNRESERVAEAEYLPAESPKGGTKVTLNISGNRRGMHNAENPPDSETMRNRRAMRRLWNKKMPALQCSGCKFSAQCPQYKAGYECAYLPFLNSHKIDSEEDLLFYGKELLTLGLQRAQLSVIMERMTGAEPTLENTEQLAYLFNSMMTFLDKMQKANQMSITVETGDSSIIGRLFGSIDSLVGATTEAKEKPIDVSFAPTESAEQLQITEGDGADQELLKEWALLNDKKSQVPIDVKPTQEELT
jgi:hypothetical protein